MGMKIDDVLAAAAIGDGVVCGILVKVSAVELAAHCTHRAEYHTRRANEKEAKLPDLKRVADELRQTRPDPASEVVVSNQFKGNGGHYQSNLKGEIESLEVDIADHRFKATQFTFFAAHLFGGVYALDTNELHALELVRR